ncbi:MAG: hypothetical protein Q7V43_35000 [Myxococcales bacterium]|nr:hypothetical protein [Myxococcales bacterium]
MVKRAVLLGCLGLGAGCAAAPARVRGSSAREATGVAVTVRNRSRFDVHGLSLRASPRRPWGPEALAPEPLRAGQDRTLRLDGCAPRDLRLVDAHGEECVLPGVAVCAENDGFTLTTDDLLRCERWR